MMYLDIPPLDPNNTITTGGAIIITLITVLGPVLTGILIRAFKRQGRLEDQQDLIMQSLGIEPIEPRRVKRQRRDDDEPSFRDEVRTNITGVRNDIGGIRSDIRTINGRLDRFRTEDEIKHMIDERTKPHER